MPKNSFRILVVDDEPRVRQAARRVLEPLGMEVDEAADGSQALAKVANKQPDLVLVDLMMPIMDGMEFLEASRRLHPDLAYIVITGYATLEKGVEAMKLGADDFIAKPFKPSQLRMVVQRVLDKLRTLSDMAIEKSRTRALFQTMTSGVLVVDAEGVVVMTNPWFENTICPQGPDPHGLPLEQALPFPEVIESLRSIVHGHAQPKETLTCQGSLKAGQETLHLQVLCSPFLDGRGVLIGALAVFEDVTALHRLDELKDEYVSMVAHEIASPLSSVVSQLQTILSRVAGELTPDQERLLSRGEARIKGIIDLSRDLLDLSKIEAGTLGELREVDLAPVMEEVMDLLSHAALKKGQSLSLEMEPGLPPVWGMRRGLLEIFTNLVSNAVKYTGTGGEIKVSAGCEGNGVFFQVADNGLGLTPGDQQKIFDNFYRVKNENTRQIVGTGLGLPIVKRLVAEHQGTITVDSAPGRGSTFKVVLPAKPSNTV